MTAVPSSPHPTLGARRARLVAVTLVMALAVITAACSSGSSSAGSGNGVDVGDPGNCLVVDLTMSTEKIDLLTSLAQAFNQTKAKVNGKCVFVSPHSLASGAAAQALADGWNTDGNNPAPVIWTPASSAWGAVLDQQLAAKGEAAMANTGTPFMNTPLVIAMPQPMAEALGWPNKALGWSDILALATDQTGWAKYGHPEWGPFRLGKTNPNFSTSGLHALIAQNYAATGKTRDLTLEDLAKPEVNAFDTTVESAVTHYGDTTLTYLNNWYRADQQGTALQYTSAIAVEEKSVIDYNSGNPDGKLDPGEEPRPPRTKLVAIYPKEGTVFSDNPLFVLDAPWVTDDQRQGAKLFSDFVLQPDNQEKVLQYNFRPGNPSVAIGAPITADNGVDPNQPQTQLQVPKPDVLVDMLNRWSSQRKSARVMLVIDISGSMKDRASPDSTETKLDLAKRAAIDSLGQFKPDDQVGLRVFSTDLGPENGGFFLDLVPIAPMASNQKQLETQIDNLIPTRGTPLYAVTGQSFDQMVSQYDPARINAVVLLTDGRNDDGEPSDDDQQLQDLLADLNRKSQGENGLPVRLFTIGYGADADLGVLRQMAEATNGASYDASDPKSITKVFTAVVSNF
ncbi:MAG: extracellular solute-binding protein [Acidimicrobiales bacterium]